MQPSSLANQFITVRLSEQAQAVPPSRPSLLILPSSRKCRVDLPVTREAGVVPFLPAAMARTVLPNITMARLCLYSARIYRMQCFRLYNISKRYLLYPVPKEIRSDYLARHQRFWLLDDCTARGAIKWNNIHRLLISYLVWFYETRLSPSRSSSCARLRFGTGTLVNISWLLTGAALRKMCHLASKLIIVGLRRLECVRRVTVDLQWFSVFPYVPIPSLRFRA